MTEIPKNNINILKENGVCKICHQSTIFSNLQRLGERIFKKEDELLLSDNKVKEINDLAIKYNNKSNIYNQDELKEKYYNEIIEKSKSSNEINIFKSKWKNSYNKIDIEIFGVKALMLYDFFYTKGFYFSSPHFLEEGKALIKIKEIQKIRIDKYPIFNQLFGNKNIGKNLVINILPGGGWSFCHTDDAYVYNSPSNKWEEEMTFIKIPSNISKGEIIMHEGMHSIIAKLYKNRQNNKKLIINTKYVNREYDFDNINEMLASVSGIYIQYINKTSLQHFHMKLQEGINSKLNQSIQKEFLEKDINEKFINSFVSSGLSRTYSMTQEFAYNYFLNVLTINEKQIFIKKIKEYRVLAKKTDGTKDNFEKYLQKQNDIRIWVRDIVEKKINKKDLMNEYIKLGKVCIGKLDKQIK